MMMLESVQASEPSDFDPHTWLGLVLDQFARAEQALGQLSLALRLPITNGSLSSLQDVRCRLQAVGCTRSIALDNRIERWVGNRPFRHLLAHATIISLFDASGCRVIVTRHLPRDATDVTPDRLWSLKEQKELLRQVINDSRSICDQVRNLVADQPRLAKLRN